MKARAHDLAAGFLAGVLAVAMFLPAAQPTNAYTWSPWRTRYYTATRAECQMSKTALNKFIGPVQQYSTACVFRVRSRFAVVDTWAGWKDWWIQIENTAPFWNAWGMKLEVQMHYNGTVVRHSPETLLCRPYSFIITVTPTDCRVIGNGTARATARMAYTASYSYLFMSASVDRGAQQSLNATGGLSVVQSWP